MAHSVACLGDTTSTEVAAVVWDRKGVLGLVDQRYRSSAKNESTTRKG